MSFDGGAYEEEKEQTNYRKTPAKPRYGNKVSVFVGGLSYNSTPESMIDFFSYAGEVLDARVIKNAEGEVF